MNWHVDPVESVQLGFLVALGAGLGWWVAQLLVAVLSGIGGAVRRAGRRGAAP